MIHQSYNEEINNLFWLNCGTISNPQINIDKGVYLFVYNGFLKRIVYVGVTNCFERRWYEHREAMLRGNRTIWRVNDNQDIYELMSYRGQKDYFKYYRKLALDNKLWASTSILKIEAINDLNEKDNFCNNWKEYVDNIYMPKIELWACKLDSKFEYSTILESQIQRAIINNYYIGSHIYSTNKDMSWLGKVEHTDRIYKTKFKFENLPRVESGTRYLLNNITDKRIIRYYKNGQLEREKERQEKSLNQKKEKLKIQETLPNAFTYWHPKENQILLFLIKNNTSYERIAEILMRTTEEVKKQHEGMKKWGWIE